ncbi:serine hydrolase domain-containing protein [Pseudonocardia endophytica]|uniref:CubicO group peptidase (Beta-lactamase class C family) n=1 Tax=Pseudonocardia endophytica TaxID=401976 RepID=A0A4R1HJ52_PSEEN|nr:serine hydrolase [Pseudonocardia endophytica]TCK22307.1 CubicO group peptidase (beta-lactamase class C family) [Pseudonocardia endophytica]
MLTRRPRRILTVLAVLVVVVGALFVAVETTTDRFYLSRVLAWHGADYQDWQRFPSRPVPTGPDGNPFRPAPATPPPWLQTVTGHPDAPPPADEREPWVTEGGQRGGAAVTEPLDEYMANSGTTAFLVARDDQLLYERYYNGSGHDATQTSFSMAKSFISALVGIAVEQGRIRSVDDPVVRYVPELAGRGMDTMTIRNLLTMSSGLAFSGEDGAGGPFGDDAKIYYTPQLRKLALQVQAASPPGQHWQYNDYDTVLMGLILERTTGRPVASLLSDEIWKPMGAEADGSWSLDSTADGFEKMASGINGRAVDFAKFGRLFLDGGRVNGRQVVPGDWVRESTKIDTTTDPADFYQYFWWIDVARPGRYMAVGNLGQFIYVVPDKHLVIVRFGERFGAQQWTPLLRSIADAAPRP